MITNQLKWSLTIHDLKSHLMNLENKEDIPFFFFLFSLAYITFRYSHDKLVMNCY